MPEIGAEEARLEEIMAGLDRSLALIRRAGPAAVPNTPVQRISQAFLASFEDRRRSLRSLFDLHVRLEGNLSFAGTPAGMFGILALFAPWITTAKNPVFIALGGSAALFTAIGIPLAISCAVCLLFSRRSLRRQRELIEEARRLHDVHLELASAMQAGDDAALERAMLSVAAGVVTNFTFADGCPTNSALTSEA